MEKYNLKINDYRGLSGTSIYKGSGEIDFNRLGKINLKINFEKSRLDDGYKIFKDHLPNYYKKIMDIPSIYSSNFIVNGNLVKDRIKVYGNLNFYRFNLYGETIAQYRQNLLL